jgi:Nucleotidyl transferase AbiEii toxin, Type IV TA system
VIWPWRSPQATRQALTDRVKARHPPELRPQRLREIAYRRLLARLFETQPDRWVVKGGAALLLRLDPNRTSNDIDLAYVAESGEHAVALEALVEAAAHDAGDFFEFDIARGKAIKADPDHPLERAISVPVVARIGGSVFANFTVDLGLPSVGDLDVDWVNPEATLTGEPAVDEIPPVATLALSAQLADKVCALFERHGPGGAASSRARDLADIAMIATQKDIDGAALANHLRREESRRVEAGTLVEPLPTALRLADEQIADWKLRWHKATRGASINFDEAQATAAKFIDPVMQNSVENKRWSATTQQWT